MFPRDTRHKLLPTINHVSARMQTACLKILTRLINFKTNFVTLLLRKFVARADGESGPTERRDSGRQATQCGLPEFASFTEVFPARGSTLCVEN